MADHRAVVSRANTAARASEPDSSPVCPRTDTPGTGSTDGMSAAVSETAAGAGRGLTAGAGLASGAGRPIASTDWAISASVAYRCVGFLASALETIGTYS